MPRKFLFALLLNFSILSFACAAAKPDSRGVEFFEKKIRPIFVEHCYKCHSQKSEKVKGGLLLDTRDGLLKGGDTGPAIVPAHPEKSLLIKAVSYTDPDLQMPPKDEKLADEQIEDIRSWIKIGAPDPRTNLVQDATAHGIDFISAKKHWAFQPIQQPPIPKVSKNKSWIKTPLDAFVLAKLNENKLKPSPPAEKRTLIRRVYFDLIGIPPTPEEVQNFLADKSSDAFAKLVDRLLASPHYGERWGRHWLDVARYADTKGYVSVNDNPRLPYAYTYRDWVIRTFNEDLPFDQFIVQQLAADQLLQNTNDNRSLAALGFLTVGRRNFQNENELIDDRIDVVSRGFLGLTVSCARCHDHKFDPIPTRDYYSLHGVFASCYEPTNLPLLTVPLPEQYTNFVADMNKAREALETYTRSNEVVVLKELRSSVGDYLLAVNDAKTTTNSVKLDELLRARKLNKAIFLRWQTNLTKLDQTNDAIFSPWFAFAKLGTNDFYDAGKTVAKNFSKRESLNPFVAKLFSENSPTNLADVAGRYNGLFADVSERWEDLAKSENRPENFADADDESLRQVLYATNSPANPPRADFLKLFLFSNAAKSKIEALKRAIVDVESTHPGAPERAMVLEDKPKPVTSKIFIRGNPATRGAEAPREFLEILCDGNCEPFPKTSSGRLELARAIASTNNPLTARVFVNRVWLNHFGAPLVDSPSDFGVRTEKPAEAELLDFLAARFMADGWSVKKLQRMILLSSVYQQSSAFVKANAEKDPANKFFWRMNPRRIDFETMRDSLLAVSGKLDSSLGGQPVNIATNDSPRRTVYALIDRLNLPNLFRTFDFANPETSSPQRFETTVAPQALFLLNSAFISNCVHGVVAECNLKSSDEPDRIKRFYETIFQREPTRSELKLGESFLQERPVNDALNPEVASWYYGSGSFDELSQRTENFVPLPFFNGSNWQGGAKMPDAKLSNLFLSAVGGHPGKTNLAAIRRWVAPRGGTINIHGELSHASKSGDGVRGRIISSRTGLLGEWKVFNDKATTVAANIEVKAGDTIDFVVDCLANPNSDNFKWSPVIEMARVENEELGLPHVWDAKQNFVDPRKLPKPIGAWEKYAQVLLLSNEFFFVE